MRTPNNLPSASRLQLAQSCAASQALPVADSLWASGEAGNAKHRALALHLEGLPLSDADEATAAWLSNLDEDDLAPLAGSSDEIAFALDPRRGTARVLGRRLERAYEGATPDELVGTADYVRVEREVDCVMVVDLKTGQTEVPHPVRNAQLRFLAVAAARAYGVANAHIGVLHAPEGRAPWWRWDDLGPFDLAEEEINLRKMVERINWARRAVAEGKTPRLTVGDHCAHCPARFSCPARVAMAKRLGGEPEQVVFDLKAMLTPETAALALARWQAATKALQEVGNALYAYASETPIPLGDGRVWGPRTSEREAIDAEKAWKVLVEKYGPAIAKECMTLETSKAGIDRGMHALRESMRGAPERPKGVPPGKATIKALNEDALKTLRDAGCVTTKTVKSFEAYVPTGALPVTTKEPEPEAPAQLQP